MTILRLSKQQLTGKLAKKTLIFDEKMKSFLDFVKKKSKPGCRKLADIYKIGKTAAANILRNEKKIRGQNEMVCENSKKHNCHGNYHKINEVLFEWYKRRCVCNIYSNNVMFNGETMIIKENFRTATLLISTSWMVRQIAGKKRVP